MLESAVASKRERLSETFHQLTGLASSHVKLSNCPNE